MSPAPTSHTHIEADRPITAPVKQANTRSNENKAITSSAPQILATVRCLVADIVQQFNGGHPGTPMGAASTGLALWGEAMRFNPKNANWFNRDRFVLSNGHACLLQYIYLYLCGYESWTLDMLKRYHSRDFVHSQAAGHPEIEFEGIEVTTGPIGQGIANAVGLAMASKHLAAVFNRDSHDIIDNKIWAMVGDGDLQEGIFSEAVSIAGHMRLNNLIVIYDNNQTTVDGNLDICFTEDSHAKMLAVGWEVIAVEGDATNDVASILEALQTARASKSGKPVFINVATQIGHGSVNQGLCPTHGAALGEEDVVKVKVFHGQDPDKKFVVPQSVYTSFDHVKERGQRYEDDWNRRLIKYKEAHPDLAKQFEIQVLSGKLQSNAASLLPTKDQLPSKAIPTRQASGLAIQRLGPQMPQLMAGSADLSGSTYVTWPGMIDFQPPETKHGDYTGRQIRYGIREHAMAAIANGLAAYSPNAILPVFSTFFMFFLYAAPAIRMSALQKLRFIGIATHDSIGIGEDGPTHQPIALASLYRAMPNLNFIRPADAEEVQGAWKIALSENKGANKPSLISLSRQGVPLLEKSSRDEMVKGAYTVWSSVSSTSTSGGLVLVATGSEVAIAVEVAKKLSFNHLFNFVRVVSMPCQRLFDEQSQEYKDSILPLQSSLVIAIEAWSSYGWARYSHASLSMHTFGMSGPQADLYQYFGFGMDNVMNKIEEYASSRRNRDGVIEIPRVGQFKELLLGHV